MLFDVPAAEDESPSVRTSRHRVTIDLRGMERRIRAFATARSMTMAACVRRAIDAVLADDGGFSDAAQVVADHVGDGPPVKVTLRLPAIHARLLAMRARKAETSQGEYVASLIEGAPPLPQMPDHAEVLKALCESTSNLSALSVDLHAAIRSLGRSPVGDLEQCRASLNRLEDLVGEHVRTASKLIADVKATRRPILTSGGKRRRSAGPA